MGTVVSIDVRAPFIEEAVIDDAVAWLHDVDQRFSTYRPDSEISRLARGELDVAQCSDDVRHVLSACAEICIDSAGAFDIWHCAPGGGLDPSGLVKGWAIDGAAHILERGGATNYCINAGGDVLARGRASSLSAWRVGIRHPYSADKVAAVLLVEDRAVATSATYERGEHIVDPRTGRVPGGLVSMTVVGPDLARADAFATAAYVMGVDGLVWLPEQEGFAGYAITDDGRVAFTSTMAELLAR
jgi:thiamine biosynthesis lipoprotein